MRIVLYQPEIPQNTGNIIRLCANTGAQLSLIEPLGFNMDEKSLRRAGLDYHAQARWQRYVDWTAFRASNQKTLRRVIGFSTKGQDYYHEHVFSFGDVLLFGPETRGLPDEIMADCDVLLRVPMRSYSRSLNLSNTVAIVLYEALRQQAFPNMLS